MAACLVLSSGCAEDTASSTTGPHFPLPGDRFELAGPEVEAVYARPGRPDRPLGATEFASADAVQGQASPGEQSPTAGTDEAFDGDGRSDRTVEEGDIYRVLGGHQILNLNSYRGLQVIDFSDVDNPEIIGRLEMTGYPVEMYVVGDKAFVLLNNWRGYYGSRTEVAVARREGGLAVSVDLSDPTKPRLLDRAWIPGWIQTSRLTRDGNRAALYVATGGWAEWLLADGSTTWESRTVVKSFDVTTGRLEARSELNLGGYVADVQATPEALLVAINDWNWSDAHSQVTLIDISDPTGLMAQGDTVATEGWINNQFNMDLRGGVLRVVSGSRWSSDRTNWVQTFDAHDLTDLAPIDQASFGPNEDLYATLFLDNSAFFVTYRRIDPFHAFAIGDDGAITEMSEFVVSGWNDFFRSVMGDSRLLGIGVNDENSRTLAVSLYDITDLTNPSPLVERAEVEANYSWSEANWDHRAFSVLENIVEIESPDGDLETGLVLLPFSGYNADWREYTAAVQIFTFSENSLTRRGLMVHGTPVRRSFAADDDLTANLSETSLSLFDTSDPDSPAEQGRVELAPNYSDLLVFGDYRARVKNGRDYYYYWYGTADTPNATVEIVPSNEHPDAARPVARFEVPGNASLHQSGDYLVAMTQEAIDTSEWPYTYRTTLQVFDLTDPTEPRAAGVLETDALQPGYGYYYGYPMGEMDDCFDCGGYWGGYGGDDIQAVPGGLAFLQRDPMQELIGREEVCNTYPSEYESCWDGEDIGCTWYSGSISCRSLDGADPYCGGELLECTRTEDSYVCEGIAASSIETQTNCYTYDRYRYWQHFRLETLDLTDPDAPSFSPTVDLGSENEGVSMLVDGSLVYVTYKRPYNVRDDSRPYVRYFVAPIDLSDVAVPKVGTPINIPGQLLAVDDDHLYTSDLLYGDTVVETAVARVALVDGRAYLEAIRRFEDQYVQNVSLDGADHVLVSHRLHWSIAWELGEDAYQQRLTVLDATSDDLGALSTSNVDSWATLVDALAGRALFQVPGGLLVFNLDNARAPYPQAYFPTKGWPQDVFVSGRDILFAAGPYGVYEFDLDAFNLLTPLR